MARKPAPLFREEQGVKQPRVWILVAILPAAFLLLLIWQVLLGHRVKGTSLSNGNVIGWTVFLWLVYLRLITVKFVTRVAPGQLSIGLRGLWTLRKIPLASVKSAEAVTYKPETYGGYGIRLSTRGRAYIASGDRGVRLKLADGGRILVGSQRPDELVRAIGMARKAAG